MNNNYMFLLFSIFLSLASHATEDKWTCMAYDNAQMHWKASHSYQKLAINLAFEACKKQSKSPSTCKISKESCEGFFHGMSTDPLWHCMAIDANAAPWKSNYYRNKDDAALAALAYCKSKSKVPSTCALNFITCTNSNKNSSGS